MRSYLLDKYLITVVAPFGGYLPQGQKKKKKMKGTDPYLCYKIKQMKLISGMEHLTVELKRTKRKRNYVPVLQFGFGIIQY